MPHLAHRRTEREGPRRPPDRSPDGRMTPPVCRHIMSGTNVRRRSAKVILTEREILAQFLKLYKTYPCLWDQKHMLYGNREARDQAYEQLLEKYKLYHENGTVIDVKKKIEHMRCAYRREHKKVLMSSFKGSQHKPHLWYYNLLTFLNENNDEDINDQQQYKNDSNVSLYEDSYQEPQEVADADSDDEEDIKPKLKRRKKSNNSSTVYVEEHLQNDDEYLEQEVLEQDELFEQPQSYIISNEAEAFGRTVGFQLKELPKMQRIFAEKLISDVIFTARLGKLTSDTAITD